MQIFSSIYCNKRPYFSETQFFFERFTEHEYLAITFTKILISLDLFHFDTLNSY